MAMGKVRLDGRGRSVAGGAGGPEEMVGGLLPSGQSPGWKRGSRRGGVWGVGWGAVCRRPREQQEARPQGRNNEEAPRLPGRERWDSRWR